MSCDLVDISNKYYFQEQEVVICNQKIPSILLDYVENFPSTVERFFTRFYYVNKKKNDVDISKNYEVYSVLFHSNRVCLISLADCHPALRNGVKSITFEIGNCDRSLNKVSGKGKKGGMILQDDSTLAVLKDNKSYSYRIPSCIRGKLIEVNERLLNPENIDILNKEGEGYIAIVLPKPEHCKKIKEELLTHDVYEKIYKI